MAKITIVSCDKCERADSKDNPIRLTTIVGAPGTRGRLDLCAECRIDVAQYAGYTPEEAADIVAAHQARQSD